MESNRYRGLHRLRRRLGFMVARSWRRKERLPVAMDEVRFHPDYVPGHSLVIRSSTDNVWRFVHGNTEPTDSGSGPSSTESVGAVEHQRPGSVPGASTARVSFDAAQYSDEE